MIFLNKRRGKGERGIEWIKAQKFKPICLYSQRMAHQSRNMCVWYGGHLHQPAPGYLEVVPQRDAANY